MKRHRWKSLEPGKKAVNFVGYMYDGDTSPSGTVVRVRSLISIWQEHIPSDCAQIMSHMARGHHEEVGKHQEPKRRSAVKYQRLIKEDQVPCFSRHVALGPAVHEGATNDNRSISEASEETAGQQ